MVLVGLIVIIVLINWDVCTLSFRYFLATKCTPLATEGDRQGMQNAAELEEIIGDHEGIQ